MFIFMHLKKYMYFLMRYILINFLMPYVLFSFAVNIQFKVAERFCLNFDFSLSFNHNSIPTVLGDLTISNFIILPYSFFLHLAFVSSKLIQNFKKKREKKSRVFCLSHHIWLILSVILLTLVDALLGKNMWYGWIIAIVFHTGQLIKQRIHSILNQWDPLCSLLQVPVGP